MKHICVFGRSLTAAAAMTLSAWTVSACSPNVATPPEDGRGGTGGTGGSGAHEKDPYELVPSEALVADPETDCPEPYKTKPPVAGLNDAYDVGGQSRNFWLLLPGSSHAGPRPLFVAFNGTGESGKSFSQRASLDAFASRGFVVLAPSSAGNGSVWPVWDGMNLPTESDLPNRDLDYFDSLVRCVAAHVPVDKHRVFIGGHSAGGIMTNYLLQRRSEMLAGGIVASGVMSLTKPKDAKPLDPMMVLVTWGGDNDTYTGGTSSAQVPAINFVEQASLASVFYDAEPDVGQANCRGPNVGHAWLDDINDWMVDLMLGHPKGLSGSDGLTLAPVPEGSGVVCNTDAFHAGSPLPVVCPVSSAEPGCSASCQLMADCLVENATVGPILAPQLEKFGFSGANNGDCGGCVAHCETATTAAADVEVLQCLSKAASKQACGPGIDGALPAIDAVNECCEGRKDSPYCIDICTTFAESSTALDFLTSCKALIQ